MIISKHKRLEKDEEIYNKHFRKYNTQSNAKFKYNATSFNIHFFLNETVLYLAGGYVYNPGHMLWDIWFTLLEYISFNTMLAWDDHDKYYKNYSESTMKLNDYRHHVNELAFSRHSSVFMRPICANSKDKCLNGQCKMFCQMSNLLGLTDQDFNNVITIDDDYNYNHHTHHTTAIVDDHSHFGYGLNSSMDLFCFKRLLVPNHEYNRHSALEKFPNYGSLYVLRAKIWSYFDFNENKCFNLLNLKSKDEIEKYKSRRNILIYDRRSESRRHWLNSNEFIDYLNKNADLLNINVYVIDNMISYDVNEQFLWFYCVDTAIMVHGATSSLTIAMKPQSTLIELCCQAFSWANRGEYAKLLGIQIKTPQFPCSDACSNLYCNLRVELNVMIAALNSVGINNK